MQHYQEKQHWCNFQLHQAMTFQFLDGILLIQICQLNNKLKIETSLETKDILNQQFSDSFAINLSNVDNCTYRQISNVVNSKI